MVRKIIKKSYKRAYKRPSTFNYSNGMSCIRYHRLVISMNWNANLDFGGEFDHATQLINEDGFARMSGLWRKFKILSATCSVLPGSQLINQTSTNLNAGPLCIAPYYGDFAGNVLTYSRIMNIPGCVTMSPHDPQANYKRAYWTTKKEFEDCEIVNLAGRSLDSSYGGFLVYCDGSGFAIGSFAATCVLTYKVKYSDPKNLS